VTSADCDAVAETAGVCVVGDDVDETNEYEQPVTARHVTGVRSVCTAGFDDWHTQTNNACNYNNYYYYFSYYYYHHYYYIQ